MTSYFSSPFFLLILPLTMAFYCAVPKRFRWVVLLAASYCFFAWLSKCLIVCIIASTAVVYVCGLALEKQLKWRDNQLAEAKERKGDIKRAAKARMRVVLLVGVLLNIGLLVALKYLGFFGEILSSLASLLDVPVSLSLPKLGVPIGISFYTFMAVSYLIDVYRETVRADHHLGRVALFLSFFPQIMEGPFCRYGQTASALFAGEPLNKRNVHAGFIRILFGFAKKIIVADRLNAFVKLVFDNYGSYDGGIIAFAVVMYTVQLYFDFSGTMDVALGIARIFNVKLPENFRQPFFSRTASEFWQRWHITLGAWFKDYVYYPVSLSKPCKALTKNARKVFGNRYGSLLASSVALFCVWLSNGLWHGAGSQYLFFGMYYFVLILLGGLIEPVAANVTMRLNIDRSCIPYRVFQTLRTLLLVFVGELFFRANSLDAGIAMFGSLVGNFSLDAFASGQLFTMKIDGWDLVVVAVGVIVLLAVGIVRERGVDIVGAILQQGAVVRWGVTILLFMLVIWFGAYGGTYAPVDPMYAQF